MCVNHLNLVKHQKENYNYCKMLKVSKTSRRTVVEI